LGVTKHDPQVWDCFSEALPFTGLAVSPLISGQRQWGTFNQLYPLSLLPWKVQLGVAAHYRNETARR